MGWGRIDDGFDDHPKVVALLDEDDQVTAGLAIGLWTLCFTWAHRNTRKRGQTPGLLPAGLPRRFFGSHGKDAAQLLVKQGLWEAQDDGGWMIHDFGDYLPTEDTRAARAEAGRRGAEKRWGLHPTAEAMANSHGDNGNLPSASQDLLSASQDTPSNDVASDGSRAPAHRDPIPVPTPIPEEPQKTSSSSTPRKSAPKQANRGTRIPDDFQVTPEMRKWAMENVPQLANSRETEKFINYWTAKSGRDATKVKWDATWRSWMLNAAERYGGNGSSGATSSGHRSFQNPPDPSAYEGDL